MKSLSILKNYKKELILGPMFKLIEAIFELIVPVIIALIIDKGIGMGDTNYVLKMGGILALLAVLGLSSTMVCQYFASKASQGYGTDLRNVLFAHINTLSPSDLESIDTEELVTIMTNDINQIQLGVAMLIRLALRAPFLVIGGLIMAMIISLKISLIFLAAIILIALILFFIMKKSSHKYLEIQEKLDEISLITNENVKGTRVIKSFGKEKQAIENFKNKTTGLKKEVVNVAKLTALLNPLTFIITNLVIILVIYFGGINVTNNSGLTTGDIVALINYMNQILLALVVVSNIVVIFTKALSSVKRCDKVLSIVNTITDGNKKHSFDKKAPIIEFENVSFKYNGSEKCVIENVNFKAYQGDVIGIIGGTGSGKTTIINLLERYYEVTSGAINIKGNNIKDYSLHDLRNITSIVTQKAVLFKGTIRSNMLMAKKDATDNEIIEALKIAKAYDFVKKYDDFLSHKVEEGGKNFSGGERQRLTIARSVLEKPEILVLDDSTSALDYLTDKEVRQNIKNMNPRPTTIIVSQRSTSIKNADLILVIDRGQMVASGKHEDIIKSSVVYQEICASQTVEEDKKWNH